MLNSNRKANGAGKTLPGEKALTTLTFSCSPYLFRPLQGKRSRAGLMHIMKKDLVEPPTYESSHSMARVLHDLSTGRDATAHTRSRSDASAKGGHYSPLARPLDTRARGATILSMNRMPRAHPRRTSSAEEHSLTCSRNEPGHSGNVTLKEGMFIRDSSSST